MIVKNPIDRVVSAILQPYLNGNRKTEVMPDIDDLIMDRVGYIPANKKISSRREKFKMISHPQFRQEYDGGVSAAVQLYPSV
jgi:hypothetical protein